MGIGDWGLGIGDWAQSPIPNPQSPIPNPHLFIINLHLYLHIKNQYLIKLNCNLKLNIYNQKNFLITKKYNNSSDIINSNFLSFPFIKSFFDQSKRSFFNIKIIFIIIFYYFNTVISI